VVANVPSYVDFEDGVLRHVVERFEAKDAMGQLQGVSSFEVATAMWGHAQGAPGADMEILALFDALQSLAERALLEAQFSSGGHARIKPSRSARAFLSERFHAEWFAAFREELAPSLELLLTQLHGMSLQGDSRVVVRSWIDEFELMVALGRAHEDDRQRYHPHMRPAAIRDLDVLEEAGLLATRKVMGPYSVQPTYLGCVRVEKGRPRAVYPDIVGPLRATLERTRLGGSLRLMERAIAAASSPDQSAAELAIRDCAAALESALRELVGSNKDFNSLLQMSLKLNLLTRYQVAAARALYDQRSQVPGLAHGGAVDPRVDQVDALFAVDVAAATLTSLAARSAVRSVDDRQRAPLT
jgi:hypothetical protein